MKKFPDLSPGIFHILSLCLFLLCGQHCHGSKADEQETPKRHVAVVSSCGDGSRESVTTFADTVHILVGTSYYYTTLGNAVFFGNKLAHIRKYFSVIGISVNIDNLNRCCALPEQGALM